MATVNPVRSGPANGVAQVFWEGMVTGDTITTDMPQGLEPLFGSVQVTGTFNGGTTVTLTGSNDGTNYVTLKDETGNDISFTSAGLAQFKASTLYVKPAIASGSADDIDVTVIYRNT